MFPYLIWLFSYNWKLWASGYRLNLKYRTVTGLLLLSLVRPSLGSLPHTAWMPAGWGGQARPGGMFMSTTQWNRAGANRTPKEPTGLLIVAVHYDLLNSVQWYTYNGLKAFQKLPFKIGHSSSLLMYNKLLVTKSMTTPIYGKRKLRVKWALCLLAIWAKGWMGISSFKMYL